MKAYLDNAATTKIDDEVINLMHSLMQSHYGNPSSIYEPGRKSRVIVEQARKKIAEKLKVSPAEIFFTSGGTEAINTIISSVLSNGNIAKVISSPIEHEAVLKSLKFHCERNNIPLDLLTINSKGEIDIDEFEQKLSSTDSKVFVSLMHVNNEIGTVLPFAKISELCRKYSALFFSDTVQSMGKLKNDFSEDIIDFAVGSAHKFHGPKGVGFIYVNAKTKINPLLLGGGQERNMRAGTENLIGIAGMAKAFEIAYEVQDEVAQNLTELKEYLIAKLEKDFPTVGYNGVPDAMPNLISLSVPKTNKNEMLLMKFDIEGVYVSGGSACSSGVLHESSVIRAIGKSDSIRPIRLSMSKYTTRQEIDCFLEVLKKV